MRKFKSGRKPAAPVRSNTSSSIRGKISAPIPLVVDDDEFPIREPGTGIATPLGLDGVEKQLRLPNTPRTPLPVDPAKHEEADLTDPVEEPTRAPPPAPPSLTPSHESTIRQATYNSPLRESGASNHQSGSSLEKPQRKKSTLKSVFGRLFGKKRKSSSSANENIEDSARAGQHRSVSCSYIDLNDPISPFTGSYSASKAERSSSISCTLRVNANQ